MKKVYLKIEGRVQRIGFRRWVVVQALEVGGLSGWVRNVEDGSVEILMCGEDSGIDEMVKRCYSGPLLARVDKISFLAERDSLFLPSVKLGQFIRL